MESGDYLWTGMKAVHDFSDCFRLDQPLPVMTASMYVYGIDTVVRDDNINYILHFKAFHQGQNRRRCPSAGNADCKCKVFFQMTQIVDCFPGWLLIAV